MLQPMQFGSPELVVQDYGSGQLILDSKLGDGGGTLSNVSTTLNSATITVDNTSGVVPGSVISGPNIPSGATVLSVNSATSLTLNVPAFGTGSGLTLDANAPNDQP